MGCGVRGDWEGGVGEVRRAIEGMRRGKGVEGVREIKIKRVGRPPEPKEPVWRVVGGGERVRGVRG